MRSNRSTRRVAVVCGALLAMFVYGSARADDPPDQTAAAATSGDSGKLVCKREKVTGSNIPKKVCRTQAQIDKEQAAMKELGDDINRNGAWSTQTPTQGQ